MPWEGHAAVLVRSIEGARAVRLPAAHIDLERPRSFTAALLEFLLPAAAEIRAAGFAVRRAVLGDDYVYCAIAGTTDFTRAFQLITSYPWGSIWTRPGLDYRTRRLLVLTATAALGRLEEFRLHVRTGLARARALRSSGSPAPGRRLRRCSGCECRLSRRRGDPGRAAPLMTAADHTGYRPRNRGHGIHELHGTHGIHATDQNATGIRITRNTGHGRGARSLWGVG